MVDLGVDTPLSDIGLDAALVDLETLKVEALTVGGLQLLGRPAKSIIGNPVQDLLEPPEREEAIAALEAMRSGAIDFYEAHRQTLPGVGTGAAWVRAIEIGGRRLALVAWLSPEDRPRGAVGRLQDVLARTVSVGIVDQNSVVRHAFVEPDNALAVGPEDLVGLRLADDRRAAHIDSIARSMRPPYQGLSIAFPISVAGGMGEATLICVLTRLAGSMDRLFMLSEPTTSARASQLEQHLWRIAAEVDASGILVGLGSMPSLAINRHPEAASLTPRQWEILRRLVGGQRVPLIARELFVSQSTVRNHLSAIFDRFGVHSQAELLAVLAETGTSSN